jgi:hypothetical protein
MTLHLSKPTVVIALRALNAQRADIARQLDVAQDQMNDILMWYLQMALNDIDTASAEAHHAIRRAE